MIDGEAARVVHESGAGMACAAGDASGLAEIVRKLSAMTVAQREAMGMAGRQYSLDNFSKPHLFDSLEKLFRAASLRKIQMKN